MNSLLKTNDYIGLVANSNGIDIANKDKIDTLIACLKELGLNPLLSSIFYKKQGPFNGTGQERADVLNTYFNNPNIKAIFDLSGGDLSNETLDYIDFQTISDNPKPFFGYSDLSTLLNAINTKSHIATYHYQLRHLIGRNSLEQKEYFLNSFMKSNMPKFKYEFIRGSQMEGIVIGGNIRCFLKLMGTKYQPDFNNKILFLESLSGDCAKMATFLRQYKQIGAFDNLNGIILGTFTEMEKEKYKPTIEEMIISLVDSSIPIAKSLELGHGEDCKCIIIGNHYSLKKQKLEV